MKTITLTCMFLILSMFAFAQLASSERVITSEQNTDCVGKNLYHKHNGQMAKQLQNHLISALEYSADMSANFLEGKVILKLAVDETGKLINVVVSQPLTAECDQLVLDAFKSFSGLKIKENRYQGASSFMFPVDFKLQ
jgi:TonB family protein